MRCSALRWPMTGPTAALRRSARLIEGVTPRFWPERKTLNLVARRRIVAAVALVGEDALDGVADQRLHVRDHGCQRVAVIRIARERLHMGDEPAAPGATERGCDGDFDAELIGTMGLSLADAFHFRRMQRIDLRPALAR